MRRSTILAVGAAAALAALLPPSPAGAVDRVLRLAGPSRYETAIAVADDLHREADTVVVATGANFPDALAAGTLASALGAPLLLAHPDGAPEPVLDAITRFGATDVRFVGGTAALPDAVGIDINERTGAGVSRLAGINRFETAALVARNTFPASDVAFLASGESFPDALVASVHAARLGARLLLTGRQSIDAVVREHLAAHPTETLVVLVSPTGLTAATGAAAGGLAPDVVVVDGPDAPSLNASLLARFPSAADLAVATTIDAYPDALSAAAISGATGAPVLFTSAASAGQVNVDLLRALDPSLLVVIGGTAAVPDAVVDQLLGRRPVPFVVPAGAEAAVALDLFARLNDERAARGVAAMEWYDDFGAWASQAARALADGRDSFVGPGNSRSSYQARPYCVGGECSLPSSGAVHRVFMHASAVRNDFLEPAFTTGGMGAYCDPEGNLWVVERFYRAGSPRVGGDSAPTPIVHDDTSGHLCTGAQVGGGHPWFTVSDS